MRLSRPWLSSASAALGAALALSCGGGSDHTTGPTGPTLASITVAPSTVSLYEGQTTTLSATPLDGSGNAISGLTLTWSSADTTVAAVSTTGIVTAKHTGVTTVTAASGSVSGSATVTVQQTPVASLTLSPSAASITVGQTVQLTATPRDAAGNVLAGRVITYTTSNGNVATVSTTGVVTGIAPGTATITATSEGQSATATITVTNPQSSPPRIVFDSSSVTFSTTTGASPAPRTVTATNGGGTPLTGLTVDSIAYAPGESAGWLTATLTGTSVPFTLTLTPTTTTLPAGTYHATVWVSAPGASNSPASISVSLTIVAPSSPTTIVYGTTTEKIQLIDIGHSAAPSLTALDQNNQTVPVGPHAFASRSPSVASVDPNGRITALGEGQTWVVVTSDALSDSVYVIVPRAADAPVLRTDLTTYVVRAGDVTTVTIVLDTRSATVGGASVGVGFTTVTGAFSSVSYSVPPGSPTPVVNNVSPGVIRVSIASATGLSGAIPLLQLQLTTPTAGLVGWLDITAIDVTGPDGTDLTPRTTSTRYPVIVK